MHETASMEAGDFSAQRVQHRAFAIERTGAERPERAQGTIAIGARRHHDFGRTRERMPMEKNRRREKGRIVEPLSNAGDVIRRGRHATYA